MPARNETMAALDSSIEKWRKLSMGEGEDMGVDNCALCQLFWDEGCLECPVCEYSGFPGCEGTPYMGWFHSHNDEFPLTVRNEEDRRSARKEYRFLLRVRNRHMEEANGQGNN